MANYLTTDTDLTAVANAIRTAGGTSAPLLYPSGFISAINDISGGGGGGGTTWDVLANQDVTIVSSSPNYFVINNYDTPFLAGETYRVTWGSTPYTCETIADTQGASYDGYIIGNLGVVGGPNTGEPFLMYRDRSNRLACATNQSTGTIHIIIEKQISSGGGNYQDKTGITPTTSSQTITPDSGYDALSSVQINAIPSQYIIPTGTKSISANGTGIDVAAYASVDVSVPSSGGKNAQTAFGVNRVNTTAYTAVSGQSITVAKSGTYDVYWCGYRSSTSGTSGSQLYIGSSAYGSENTTFNTTYTNFQLVHLSNVSLTADQTITVRARSRGTSYYMYICNLTIIEA